jgi:hypothetical protein
MKFCEYAPWFACSSKSPILARISLLDEEAMEIPDNTKHASLLPDSLQFTLKIL